MAIKLMNVRQIVMRTHVWAVATDGGRGPVVFISCVSKSGAKVFCHSVLGYVGWFICTPISREVLPAGAVVYEATFKCDSQ